MENTFFLLLQINDAAFPIGGYSHSYGLETYIQKGAVKNAETAKQYVIQNINTSFLYTELLAAALAFDAAQVLDMQEICELEEIVLASKAPLEMRQAARKLGSRFVKTVRVLRPDAEAFAAYQEATHDIGVSHAVAYGVFCAATQIPKPQTLSAFQYAQAAAMVTNCVKTIPLSQTDGQRILSECHALFSDILNKLVGLTKDDLCRSCPGLDIRSMQHETLYSRLYMS